MNFCDELDIAGFMKNIKKSLLSLMHPANKNKEARLYKVS